jgi:hypothetical protein
MQRINTATKAVDKFGAGKHGFNDGNKAGGVAATVVDAAWVNGVQEELLTVIEAAGLTPDNDDMTQLATAIQSSKLISAENTGTADALVGVFTPVITTLTIDMVLYVRAAAANTTSEVTFTPNNGVIADDGVVKGNNLPLAIGDIAGGGHWLCLKRDATLGKWVLQNPAHGVVIPVYPAFSVDRNGANQMSIANSVATKVAFNHVVFDTNNNFDSISNYRFTPTVPGKYLITFQCRFNNGTDQSTAWASIYKNGSAYAHGIMVQSGVISMQTSSVSRLVDMNGSTDYIEFYVLQDTGSIRDLLGAINQTFAQGHRIP